MNRKAKLAQLILIEVEALKAATTTENQCTLAEEITKDAVELAKLIQEEQNVA